MNRKNFFFILLAMPVLLYSCSKDKHTSANGDWLFPIAKGSLSLTSLNELKNKTYNVSIPALSINQPVGVPVSSPGISINHVGPFAMEVAPWLHRIDIDSLEVGASLTNNFPIPIGAGTHISIRNTGDADNSNIVARILVPNDVLPGSTFDFDIRVDNKFFGDSVYFFLDSFKSPPYANVVFTNTPSRLTVKLKVIAASFIQIYSNKVFSAIDTNDFTVGDDDNLGSGSGGAVSDTSVSGYLNVYFDNALPAHSTFQAYFLAGDRATVLDSLFPSELKITGINTDASGNPLSVISTVTRVKVTRGRIDHIKQAKYVVTKANLNTIGYTTPWVSANRKAKLDVQLTGDLNIKIKF